MTGIIEDWGYDEVKDMKEVNDLEKFVRAEV